MKSIVIGLFAGAIGCVFALQLPAAESTQTKEKVVHSFGAGTDGENPISGLIDVDGTLYGTTPYGGANCKDGGCGTVFSVNPTTGAETVLYSFGGSPSDGSFPYNSLTNVKGTLYGTTSSGGAYGTGTVFSFNLATGTETVLYSFCPGGFPCSDGVVSEGNLIYLKGKLYGTTAYGGTNCQSGGGCGTVFSINPKTGAENVIYSFCSKTNCSDGQIPYAGLVDVKGTLYGTTSYGGANCPSSGCGTAFSLEPTTGAETVLYSFCAQQNCVDGAYPYASLAYARGLLYGTTPGGKGGANCQNASGCGNVFSLDPATGAEKVLYSFCTQQNCTDGNATRANLIFVKDALYGAAGGGTNDGGVLFALDLKTGAESVLYSFCSQLNCADGEGPSPSLVDMNRTLYGTTQYGGANNSGAVFAIKGF
jgi:uncharacterized repeat protein (TIGR03803 family)